jgi:hypothetical protein
MSVPIILVTAMPPVVTVTVLSPVLVILVSVEMESHPVKVTIETILQFKSFFQILMSVPTILAMAMPPVVTPQVLSPVLVILDSMEMESLVKVQCTIFDTLLIIAIIFILDIMECQLGGSSPCSDDATCTDTHGSFTCICNSGFAGDGFSCESKSWSEFYV